MKWLKAFFLCAVTAAACFFLVEAGLTVRQSRFTLHELDELATQYSSIGQHADEVLVEYDKEVPLEKQRFANEERDLQKATTAAKDLLQRSDLNLNGSMDIPGVLPTLAKTLAATGTMVADSSAAITSTSQRVDETFTSLQPTLENLSTASVALSVQAPAILADLQNAARDTSTITANGAHMSDDGVKIADHYEKIVLAPVSKVKTAVMFLASVAQHLFGL